MESVKKPRKYLFRFFKILGWVILSVIFLLIAVAISIQIPWVQNKIVQKAVGYLKDTMQTEVRLRHVSLSFPKRIVIEGLYVEDRAKDTLLYVGELGIDTDLWALTQNTIELNDVAFDTLVATIKRPAGDAKFNFDFIIESFSPKDTTAAPTDTTATPWQFNLEDVELKNTRIVYDDLYSGNEFRSKIGELSISMDEFDLNNLVFQADEIILAGTKASYFRRESTAPQVTEPSDTTSSDQPVVVMADQINFDNVRFDFTDYTSNIQLRADVGKIRLDADEFDLEKQVARMNSLEMEHVFASFYQMKTDTASTTPAIEDSTATPSPEWLVALEDLDVSDIAFQYYNFNAPTVDNAFDFNRIWISKLDLEADDILYHGISDMKADIQQLAFRDKSGFSVTAFETDFAMTDQTVDLKDFKLESGGSAVEMSAAAKFKSFTDLSKNYPDASVDLTIEPSTIAIKDVLFFAPTLLDSLPLTISPSMNLRISAQASGLVKDLTLAHFDVSTLSNTTLQASGSVKGIPDLKNSSIRVDLKKFYTTAADMQRILPDSLLPDSLQLPEWILLTANAKGSINAPDITALLKTDLGSVSADAKLDFDSTARQNYDAKVHVNKFQLGRLMMQDSTFGIVDLEASAKGRGFDMKTINSEVHVVVNQFDFNQYAYKDFKLDGSLHQYFFSGTGRLEDKNLDLVLKGDLDYKNEVPRYKLNLELKNADFHALNLSERALRLRGVLGVDLATEDFKVLNGNVSLRKVAVFNGEKLYAVDSLLFASIDQRGESKITIDSDIISGKFEGNINLFGLPNAVKRHFNQYFSLRDSAFLQKAEPQNFNFNLEIKNTDLITEILLPDLEPFVPGEISGEFDSEAKRLRFDLNLSEINYAGLMLDSVWLKVRSNARSFDYTFALEKIRYDTMKVSEVKLSGNVMNDSIYSIVTVLDSLQKEKYVLGGVFNSYEETFQFRFLQRLLTINYEDWKTPLYNTLRFTSKGVQPNNFYISNGQQRILLLKKENQDSTLSVVFNQLDLKNITSIIEGVTPLGGIIDGDFTLNSASQGAFSSELKIQRLNVLEQQWGDLSLKVSKHAGPLSIDLGIEGENVSIKSAGTIDSEKEQPEIHLNTTLSRIEMAALEPLVRSQVRGMNGQLTGAIKVDGPASKPEIQGDLRFKGVEFTPVIVGSKFILKDERIELTGSGLTLNDFKIMDGANHTARINGTIKTKTFSTFDLGLTFEANNFQVINTTEDQNDLFYGNVSINAKARVNGTSDFPKIILDASLSKGSTFTYIVPEAEKSILEQEGIVRFVDRDAAKDPFLSSIEPKDTVTSKFTGIELTANIELRGDETFNIVIDPVTGDKLSVKGNTTLTLDIDETGDMQLTGRYEINEGTYNLSFYKLVKRDFSIVKGGTITWSGNPLEPQMDLTAVYKVQTSPIDLIANQSTNEQELNTFRQRMPFEVYLIIKGNLLQPEISFQLDMPIDNQNAFGGMLYAKIKDINTRESDLNKQVFALLILQRFISENPFSSQGGSDIAATARTSVSRILTDQLNRLTDNIKGVQLTFDVRSFEDFSTGTAQGQTELQLGVQKNIGDRLVVKVSGSVDVEGNTKQNSFQDYIGDLALEYKLTPDGRIRVTGFRNSNYDMIDGELIETGAGLIYIKDFDAFRQLFKSNADTNQ